MGELTKAQKAYLAKAQLKNGLGPGGILNSTANALERRGLVRRCHDDRGLGFWFLTDAGRAALTQDGKGKEDE